MKRKATISEELKDQYEKQLRRIKRFIRQAAKRGYDFPDTTIPKRPKTITEASVRKLSRITPDVLYKKATYTKDTGEVITGLEGRKHERKQAAIKAAETRRIKALDLPKFKKQPIRTPHTVRKPLSTKQPENKKQKKKTKSKKTPREKYYDKSDHKKADKGKPIGRAEKVLENILGTLEDMLRDWKASPTWTTGLELEKVKDKNLAQVILNNAISQLGREQVAINCEKHADEIIPLLEEILYASGSKEGNFKDGRTQVNFDIIRFQSMLLDRATTPEENWELVDVMESFFHEDIDEDTGQYYSGYTTATPGRAITDYDTTPDDTYD